VLSLRIDLGVATFNLKRVFDCLDRPGEAGPTEPPVLNDHDWKGELRLTGVSVSYGTKPVLHDVSVHVPAGRKVWLVGRNGTGKTTLSAAVDRLIPYQGLIELDRVNVATLPLSQLRRLIAVLLQDAPLGEGRVVDVLRLAKPDATEQQCWQCSTASGSSNISR
jgi:ABC-type multidrug transport system fused ATPase/permease subunit